MPLHNTIRQLEEKHGCTVGCAIRDAQTGEVLASYRENLVFKSASLIKTPIMLCALEDVERGLLALDAAVRVVCGVEDVQPQTEVLFAAPHSAAIPVYSFRMPSDRWKHRFHPCQLRCVLSVALP